HQITAVNDILFDSVYLVITVYSHYSLCSRVILYDVVLKMSTVLTLAEPGYAAYVSASSLDILVNAAL
ncbi:hypothetical protein L0F63_001707, partial [Massospora cicadina]